MSELTVTVQRREGTGTNKNRRVRASGLVPGVVYGGKGESVAVQVEEKRMTTLLRDGGANTVLLLRLDGTDQSRHVMVREIQTNPLNGRLRHLDFQRIDMTAKVEVEVPVELIGTPEGVKTHGGIVEFINREISVSCLPGDIPQSLEVPIDALMIGDHVEVHEVALPENVELIDDPHKVLLSVAPPAVEEEEEEGDEDELLEATTAEPERVGGDEADDD